MRKISPKKGLNKKYFGPPLSVYFEQIRQVCDRFGYKIIGEVKVELKNGDNWSYNFSEKEGR
jgi:hypothetical protein